MNRVLVGVLLPRGGADAWSEPHDSCCRHHHHATTPTWLVLDEIKKNYAFYYRAICRSRNWQLKDYTFSKLITSLGKILYISSYGSFKKIPNIIDLLNYTSLGKYHIPPYVYLRKCRMSLTYTYYSMTFRHNDGSAHHVSVQRTHHQQAFHQRPQHR